MSSTTPFSDDQVWLSADTKIEPLACRWYAWSHLVSPGVLALNLAFRHVPIIKSFFANPPAHVRSARDPKFLCAPFMQLEQSDLPAVKALMHDITTRYARFVQFAADLVSLEQRLRQAAKGQSLDGFYEELPPTLVGLVELTYDLGNNPTIRLLEEFLYDCDLDISDTQELAFFNTADASRSFFLNTPRLPTAERMLLKMPFRDERVGQIAAARITPTSFGDLCRALQLETDDARRFRQYFNKVPPPRSQPEYRGAEVRIRYFGHAAVLIQSAQTSIMIDPVVAWEQGEGRLTFADLPDFIDYVFLTHNHQDHVCLEVLLQLRGRIGKIIVPRNNPGCLADPSLKLMLQSIGFDSVVALDSLEEIRFRDGSITSVPFYGEHSALNIFSKHGMLLQMNARKLLFVADADCVDRGLYARLAARTGRIDTLFIGMECYGAPLSWLYGPYFSMPISRRDDEARRLSGSNCARAWAVVEELRPRRVFVYAMGQEPWLRHLLGLQYDADSIQITESAQLVQRCQAAGLESERLFCSKEILT